MGIRGIDNRGAIQGESQQALHTVQKGDTLKSIAKLYSITSDAILKLNPHITDQMKLQEGLAIHIPGASQKSTGQTQKLSTKDVFEHSKKSNALDRFGSDAQAMKLPGDALAMKHPRQALPHKMIGDAQAMKLPGDALAIKHPRQALPHKMIGDAQAMKLPGDALAMKHPRQALPHKMIGNAQAMKLPGDALAMKHPGEALAQKPAAQAVKVDNLKSFDLVKLKK